MPIEQAIYQLKQFISYENEYWLHARLPYFAITPDILKEAGVVPEAASISLTFEQTDGLQITITPPIVLWNAGIPWIVTRFRKDLPLYRQNTSANYWYKIVADSSTLWLQYNRCADAASNPMTSFAAEMFSATDANGVTRIVIDLRNNTGGNSTIIRPVINGLRQRPSSINEDECMSLRAIPHFLPASGVPLIFALKRMQRCWANQPAASPTATAKC